MMTQTRRRSFRLAFAIVLTAVLGRSMILAQTPAQVQFAAHRMDDDFLYEVVDVGFGQTPGRLRRVWSRGRSEIAFRSSGPGIWLALRVTNLSQRLASRNLSRVPLHLQPFSAIDDARNEYSVRRMTVEPPVYADVFDWAIDDLGARRGDYAAGAFSIELLYVPASELMGEIKELQMNLHDAVTAGGRRTRYFFTIRNPRSLKRDFKSRNWDYRGRAPDAGNLPVEARTELTSSAQ